MINSLRPHWSTVSQTDVPPSIQLMQRLVDQGDGARRFVRGRILSAHCTKFQEGAETILRDRVVSYRRRTRWLACRFVARRLSCWRKESPSTISCLLPED